MQWAVVLVAPAVLIWAASISMLGLSRARLHACDQPPDPELARQARPPQPTPYIAIWVAAVLAARAAVPADIELLAGLYAFGALLAIAIAHISVIRLRFTDPDRERPYRIPFNVGVRGRVCRCRRSAPSSRAPAGSA